VAFVRKNLERIAGGMAGKQIYHYNAGADTVATVTGADYFDGMENEMGTGDVIICIANNNTTIDNLLVTSARGVATTTTSATEGVTAT
jgi:hypothetical protein